MFTIKIYNDENSYEVIETPHYHISKYSADGFDVVEITAYKSYLTTDGVSYRLCSNDIGVPHFKYAYIENSSGKTIDHIR